MEKKTDEKALLAVVRVRGMVNLASYVKRTFELMNLYNKNWCVLVEDTKENRGMIFKVKDFVTWGEITEPVLKELLEKRGEVYQGRETDSKSKINYTKFMEIGGKKYKKFIRLSPPKKGYGKNGVKMSFNKGGALGYRADKINDLITRMI